MTSYAGRARVASYRRAGQRDTDVSDGFEKEKSGGCRPHPRDPGSCPGTPAAAAAGGLRRRGRTWWVRFPACRPRGAPRVPPCAAAALGGDRAQGRAL